jgi:fatty-acyl-CoA synthase
VRVIASSGAMFSNEVKSGLLEHVGRAMIIDLIAASEGSMGMSIATVDAPAETGRFQPLPGVIVVSEDGRPIEPGSGEAGLVALPGGADAYYKDDAKSASTFQVIEGRRYTIPGDFAIPEADGSLTLLGRGSSSINTAGEKVYPEEVEEVLKALPSVEDALVFGVPDERFGQRVAAVLSRAAGTDEPVDTILAAARERLASYKVPRSVVIVAEVPRTQVGKPDYPTAKALFEAAT